MTFQWKTGALACPQIAAGQALARVLHKKP